MMSSRSMQNYIMPYAMIALVDEKLLKVVTESGYILTISIIVSWLCFKQINSLFSQYEPMTTAAVEVIGAVCRRLTWSKYLFYLKHFVHVLQTGIAEQKLAVRYTSCAFVLFL